MLREELLSCMGLAMSAMWGKQGFGFRGAACAAPTEDGFEIEETSNG